MQVRIPDYDLSFLKIHEVGSISFNLSCFNILSSGPYDPATHSWPDTSRISIECEFELNGTKVDRGALLVLLGQSIEDAWIDLNYELHLRFASGDELVTIRNGGGFESYQIEWSLDPKKYVAII